MPSIGMLYDGSKDGLNQMDWWKESGIYAIRPTYFDDCPGIKPMLKIGMAGGSSSRQLGVRLSNHASALVSFTILFVITVRSNVIRETTALETKRVRKSTSTDPDAEPKLPPLWRL